MRNRPIGWVLSAPELREMELKIRNSTPNRLKNTPPAFFKVIGSFRKIAATNIVMIGLVVLMIDASIDVVMVIALRNAIWVIKRPSIEAIKVRYRSLPLIFSFGTKIDAIQNRSVAPIALKQKRAIGDTTPESAIFLQNMIFKPKMR